ncbi:aldo/keto reductase [Parasphingorhabdus pacifica]
MRYSTFGNTGLRVSEFALGTMRLPHDQGKATPESTAIFEAFAESGGNFLDTADAYGAAEQLTRTLVNTDRESFVIGSKYTLERRDGDVNSAGSHRKNMVGALESSLRRLGTDYLDIYWVHARDVLTPVEETMRALDDQVRAGKVLYVGVSDWPAWEVAQANTLASLRGWTPFQGIQIEYSLAQRTGERELVPMAHGLGLTVTAWSPLGGGQLARGENAVSAAVEEVATALGAAPGQVALAWLRTRQTPVIPLLGASREAQMRQNLGALDVELSDDQLMTLERASEVELGFPGDFLGSAGVRDVIYGSRRSSIAYGM